MTPSKHAQLTVCVQCHVPYILILAHLSPRLRAEQQGKAAGKLGKVAARNWKAVTTVLASALTVAKKSPPMLVQSANALMRTMMGADVVPKWNQGLPKGGAQRKPISNLKADILYFPSCINSLLA